MKEFEKFRKKYWYINNYDTCSHHLQAQIEMNILEKGWKAALEHIMRVGMRKFGNDFLTDEPLYFISHYIRKELGEFDNDKG